MKKLLKIIFGILAILCLGILIKWHRSLEIPKLAGGTTGIRMLVAEDFIHASENPEFSGNTSNAVEFAKHFSIGMRSRDLTTPSVPIPTYCFMQKNSFVILALLPEMSQFAESKKQEVEEFAWGLANEYATEKHPELKAA